MSVKKILPLVIAVFLLSVSLSSCKKDVLNPTAGLETKCEEAADDISAAVTAFGSNPTQSSCEAYKSALLDYVNSCAGYGLYNSTYEEAIKDMDCSQYN